jgi:hypothetical protein
VETDKKENRMNMVNSINDDEMDNSTPEQEVAAFRPQQQQQPKAMITAARLKL